MKKFTKVYKAPGYPVDPKLEQQRIWEGKWPAAFIHQDPRETGGLFAGMDRAVSWKEIDAAVIEEMIKREENALKGMKWKFHMGMDAPPKIW